MEKNTACFTIKRVENGRFFYASVELLLSDKFDEPFFVREDWAHSAKCGIQEAMDELMLIEISAVGNPKLVELIGTDVDTTCETVMAAAKMATFRLFGVENKAILQLDPNPTCKLGGISHMNRSGPINE